MVSGCQKEGEEGRGKIVGGLAPPPLAFDMSLESPMTSLVSNPF